MRRLWHRAAALFFLAFAIRIAYDLRTPATPLLPDAGTADVIAWNVASDGRYLGPEGLPTAYRPPSYVLFVATIYKIAGHNYNAVRFVQAAMGAVLVLIIISLTSRLTKDPLAPWLAGFMTAVYPFFIYYDSHLLSESFLVFWLVLAIGLFLDWQKKPISLFRTVGCAVAFAILSLAKTIFILLFAGIWLVEAAIATTRRDGFQRLARLLLMAIVFAFPLFLWGQRNESIFGRFVLDTHGGITSVECIMFYPQCKQGIFPEFFRNHPLREATIGMNEAEADAFYTAQTKHFIRTHPWRYLRQSLGNLKNFWRFYPRGDLNYKEGWLRLTIISLITEPFLLITGLLGLLMTRKQWRTLYPIYLLILLLTGIHALSTGQMRYRLPLMPFAIIFSATFLASKRRHSIQ